MIVRGFQNPKAVNDRHALSTRTIAGSVDGFTLMETLLALALLGVVMGSIAGSLDLYWRYRRLSNERLTESQLLRGILEDLTSDVRASTVPTFVLQVPVDDSRSSTQSSKLPETQKRAETSFHEQFLSIHHSEETPVHFVGTKSCLAILTDHQNSRFSSPSATYTIAPPHHVVWCIHNGGSLRLPLTHHGPLLLQSTIAEGKLPTGLFRLVRHPDTEHPSASSGPPNLQTISEHVSAITFRYFDGSRWVNEWNSLIQFKLPRAVEVSIVMKRAGESPFRFVIEVPQGRNDESFK